MLLFLIDLTAQGHRYCKKFDINYKKQSYYSF